MTRGWALVTAGGGGLGGAIASDLLKRGYDVLVHYRNSAEKAQAIVQMAPEERVAVSIQADLSNESGRQQLMNSVTERTEGRLSVLVNNLGVFPERTQILETSVSEFRETFELTCVANFDLSQKAVPLLRRSSRARVINIADAEASFVVPRPWATAYYIAKMGVLILTKTLARELGPDGITVNAVSPGFLENSIGSPTEKIPMGRKGRLLDMTQTIGFLLSPEADYLTGADIPVAGGYALGSTSSLG